jgi:hypothetical protein
MAKTHPYFKFYCSEWNDGDITLEDFETQGVFIGLCSLYWSRECILPKKTVDKRFRNNLKNILTLEKEGIIKILGSGLVKISFLDEQWGTKDGRSSTSKTNGSKGGRPKKPNKPNEEPNNNLNDNLTKPNIEKSIEDKKREEEKTKAKKACELFDLTLPLFEKQGAKNLHQEFCEYWCAVNELTDTERWKEDPYFKNSLSLKVSGWIDRAKNKAGQNNPVSNHPHQEFLEQWIIKAKPPHAQIEAGKSILLQNHQDLENKHLLKSLASDPMANLDALITRAMGLQVRADKRKLRPPKTPKNDLPEKIITIKEMIEMDKLMPEGRLESSFPELFERLEKYKKERKSL